MNSPERRGPCWLSPTVPFLRKKKRRRRAKKYTVRRVTRLENLEVKPRASRTYYLSTGQFLVPFKNHSSDSILKASEYRHDSSVVSVLVKGPTGILRVFTTPSLRPSPSSVLTLDKFEMNMSKHARLSDVWASTRRLWKLLPHSYRNDNVELPRLTRPQKWMERNIYPFARQMYIRLLAITSPREFTPLRVYYDPRFHYQYYGSKAYHLRRMLREICVMILHLMQTLEPIPRR